jgi:thiamine pyrophosphokinase
LIQRISANWKSRKSGVAARDKILTIIFTGDPVSENILSVEASNVLRKPALIFANGDINDGPMVRRALAATASAQPYVVAADGGARVALHFGYRPDIVIGDLDSLSPTEVDALQAQGVQIERYPPAKDETDLELALLHCAALDCGWLRVIGSLGDRFDQTLANVYLLALPSLAGRNAALVAGRQELYLLRPGDHRILGTAGDTVSLLPLGGAVSGIVTGSLQYPLRDETLYFGPARGVSNVMLGAEASLAFDEGTLLIVHTAGRA